MGFKPEDLINIQKPFSYLPPTTRKRVNRASLPLNYKQEHLPQNYGGICTVCGFLVQKVRKTTVCKKCVKIGYNNSMVQFPKDLRPWVLVSPNLTGKGRFSCIKCGLIYFSAAYFLAICGHKTHPLDGPRLTCRFCCTKSSPNVLANIHKYWTTEEETQRATDRLVQEAGRQARHGEIRPARLRAEDFNGRFPTRWVIHIPDNPTPIDPIPPPNPQLFTIDWRTATERVVQDLNTIAGTYNTIYNGNGLTEIVDDPPMVYNEEDDPYNEEVEF